MMPFGALAIGRLAQGRSASKRDRGDLYVEAALPGGTGVRRSSCSLGAFAVDDARGFAL